MIKLIFFLFSFALFSQDDNWSNTTNQEEKVNSRRFAIIIGINDYQDKGIYDLKKSKNDAKLIAKILEEQGGFDDIYLMTEEQNRNSSLYPNRINIEAKLDYVINQCNSDDLIFFYFSGQGIADPNGSGYLLPIDASVEKSFYTGIKLDEIFRKLNERDLKKSIFFVDASREQTAKNSKGYTLETLNSGYYNKTGISAKFFSAKSGDYSYEDNKSEFGVFTKFIAEGLEGKADSNKDGLISLIELIDYVIPNVEDWAYENNKNQKPFGIYKKEIFTNVILTESSQRDTSYLVKNAFTKNPGLFPALLRSFFIPGWGQWYRGGGEKGLSYFAIFCILGGTAGYFYNPYADAKKQYDSTVLIPASPGQGDTLAINFIIFNPKREELNRTQNNFYSAVSVAGAFWAWNLLDLMIFKGNDFFWAIDIKMNPIRSNPEVNYWEIDKQANLKIKVEF
jgi:hypothetical protein